jgi:hypothetical protein
MSTWSNTIQGIVAHREKDKYEKFEREEHERRRIDMMEYELQRENRKQAVDNANKVAHANMDNVKALHSKMMLSDVMYERDLQINHQIKKKQQAQ